ncbi:MAG: hypothetical protein WHT29_04470 [Bacteroidales bacterium]|nr:hypothetical protein [Bacteroidales bacterium]HOK98028.1 hypothetical protein [Bacteroidales bacterium]HPO64440.1 hypothetical protein [Bacteroidales bacterium]
MKKIFSIVLLFIVTLGAFDASAQCKGFAKKICKAALDPYIHDGNFHAAVLTEGEEAELYKTFYSDTEYRIAVCGSEQLPKIEFKVVDANNNVLYSNKEHNYATTWDFRLSSSQQLKIVIKVLTSTTNVENVQSGCVAIMFGFKESK